MGRRVFGAMTSLVAAMLGVSGAARGADPCTDSYQEVQLAMKRGRLAGARAAAQRCVSTCSRALAQDCEGWSREIEVRQPTVIFECQGCSQARVLDNGAEVAARLDGRSVAVDPGERVFRFELPEGPHVDVSAIINEGDKLRRVVAIAPHSRTSAASDKAGPTAREGSVERPIPWTAVTFGAIGLGAAAGFTTFGLIGKSAEADLRRCEPNCTNANVDRVTVKYAIADAMLGVSIVSTALAGYFFLTRPTFILPGVKVRASVLPLGSGAALRLVLDDG